MKDIIILEKVRKEKMLLESIVNTIALVEIAQISSFVHLAWKYNWEMSNADLDAAKNKN